MDAAKLVKLPIGTKSVTPGEANGGWTRFNNVFKKHGDSGATLATLQKPDLLSNLIPALRRKKAIAAVFAALNTLESGDRVSWSDSLKCVRKECGEDAPTVLVRGLDVEKAFEVLAHDAIAGGNRDSLSAALSILLGLENEERRAYASQLMRKHLGLEHTLDFMVQRATDPFKEDPISFRQAQSLIIAILKQPSLLTDEKTGRKINWAIALSSLCTSKFMLKPKFSELDPQKTSRRIAGELFEQLGGILLLREQNTMAQSCFDRAHELFKAIGDETGMDRVDTRLGPLKRQSW